MHRDPFCSDAVVCQFYGTKEAALYRPERAAELSKAKDGSSFGGFIDVREDQIDALSVEPDFHGIVEPGEMIYIPNGWLHDVLAIEDSVSITWNFVHQRGSAKFQEYLNGAWESDSEFEILQYFHRATGNPALSASEIAKLHFATT
jgi:dTDP-4-dehydrorhamnose 3,5-epimerase-like enzyme